MPKKTPATTQAPQEEKATQKGPSPIAENIKLTITIPVKDVQEAYQACLTSFAQEVELPGFRRGKAPTTLVEGKVGKSKIFEAAIDKVLPPAYAKEITSRKLRPIAAPHVQPKSLEEGKDWVFEVETAEAPQVALGEYKKVVQEAKAALSKKEHEKDEKEAKEEGKEDEKLKTIFEALLKTITVQVPEILIREEVNHNLGHLVEQLEKMHIPLEDYLKSLKKTADELRQEYAMSSLATLQLEFIIAEIAKDAKISVEKKEVDDIIASIPDELSRKANDTPRQRMNIEANLIKRKTVSYLLDL